MWQRIQGLDEEAAYWDGQRSALAEKFDEVKLLDEELAGVGEQLASIVYSELGDPRRYKSAKAYAKATGLTPGYRESAGKRSKKTITREGSSHVRWALTRAVVACLRCRRGAGVWVKTWVQKMKRRKSTKATIVASLKADNPRASLADVTMYADAFLEYQAAQANIAEHGSIVFHPRTGAPIENPYLVVRDRAPAR